MIDKNLCVNNNLLPSLAIEEVKPMETVKQTIEVTQEEVVTMGYEVSEKVIGTKTVEQVTTLAEVKPQGM